MQRFYAIGDIHGQREKLAAAHARIAADRRATGDDAAQVVHVGDLVDRGPDSRGVIQDLIDGQVAGAPWIVLRGNHDRMFQDFLADRDRRQMGAWLHTGLGGAATLASYGVDAGPSRRIGTVRDDALATVPETHRAFLDGLSNWHEAAGLLFVHAGIRPGLPLARQSEEDLLWIRDGFLWHRDPHPWLVVHGHTPVAAVSHMGNRLNIDTGAGFGGPLAAVVIEDGQVFELTERGRRPVAPEG